MSRAEPNQKPPPSLLQRVSGWIAFLFLGGSGLFLLLHEGTAMLTGAPGSPDHPHWGGALVGLMLVLLLAIILAAKSKSSKRHQRMIGLLICMLFTIPAVLLVYELFAPEHMETSSVEVLGFGRTLTTDAGQISSHGLTAHMFAIAFTGVDLLLWYLWLWRVPGSFGEPRRPRRK